jgi:quercetin dioxygenase-like cupin family protein
MPEQVVPQHNHENSEGLVYMVKGSMLFTIGEKEVCIAEGDVISFNGNEMLGVSNNTGINASCMVTLSSNANKDADIQEIGFQSGEPYKNV